MTLEQRETFYQALVDYILSVLKEADKKDPATIQAVAELVTSYQSIFN